MIRLNTLKPAPGSRHRRKIVGRGEGSGHGGKGSTRGFKGQTARSGDSHMKHGFEGGQIPLIRRIPKRGFKTMAFRTVYALVNVGDINAVIVQAGEVTPESLRAAGLVKGSQPRQSVGRRGCGQGLCGEGPRVFRVRERKTGKGRRQSGTHRRSPKFGNEKNDF